MGGNRFEDSTFWGDIRRAKDYSGSPKYHPLSGNIYWSNDSHEIHIFGKDHGGWEVCLWEVWDGKTKRRVEVDQAFYTSLKEAHRNVNAMVHKHFDLLFPGKK